MFKAFFLSLSLIISLGICAQSEPQEFFVAVNYSNWVSVDYLNCLKTQLPCECEKSGEIFLIDLDTTGMYLHIYDGASNQDYYGGDLEVNDANSYYVLNYDLDALEAIAKTDTLGTISIFGRILSYVDSTNHETQFVKYGEYGFFPYLFGNVTWLNEQLSIRGYDSLQELLKVDDVGCFCNWELYAINLVSSGNKQWILEMENNELVIYRWVNPPKSKSIGQLKIKKKEVQRLKW